MCFLSHEKFLRTENRLKVGLEHREVITIGQKYMQKLRAIKEALTSWPINVDMKIKKVSRPSKVRKMVY